MLSQFRFHHRDLHFEVRHALGTVSFFRMLRKDSNDEQPIMVVGSHGVTEYHFY